MLHLGSRFAISALMAHLTLASATSIGGQQRSPSFRVDQWTGNDGLPSHTVMDIAQTRDGYLWVATTGGLARFNGREFVIFNRSTTPGLDTRVTGLLVGAGDTLWAASRGLVGLIDGVVVTRRAGGASRHLAQDADGRVWVGGNGVEEFSPPLVPIRLSRGGNLDGLHALRSQYWNPVRFSPLLWRDATGTIWALNDGTVSRIEEERIEPMWTTAVTVLVTYPSRGQLLRVWDEDAIGEVRAVDSERVLATYRRSPLTVPRLIDRSGRLWVTTEAGLDVYMPGNIQPVAHIPMEPDVRIGILFEDREGNLWAGTTTHGLFRIQEQPIHVVAGAEGLDGQVSWVSRGRRGTVLARTRSGFYRIRGVGERVERISLPRLDVQPRGLALEREDDDGAWWSGTGASFHVGEGGEVVPLDSRRHRKFVPDPLTPGVRWTRTDEGIYRITTAGADATVSKVYDVAQPVGPWVDRRGSVWFASQSNRRWTVMRLSGDSAASFHDEADLIGRELRTFWIDRDGAAWIGTYGSGIIRLVDGEYRAVTEADGLGDDVVSAILEDDAGNFWMSGNRGIHRVRRSELNAFLDGTVDRVWGIRYGERDGMLHVETSGAPSAKSTDGRLWFPTMDGVAAVDPAIAMALDADSPIVRIEAITTGGEPVDMSGGVSLSPNQRRFEVQYDALSLRNPDALRFQYRLDGLDDRWNDGTDRRATYAGLGPGRFDFRVRAMNAGGVWSERDAVVAVTVAPFVYETGWFLLFSALTVTALAYGGYRSRVSRLHRRHVELEEQVEARTTDLEAAKVRTEEALQTVAHQADQLRELDEAKSRFFANVSHEFRTPLSLILGPLEDLRDGRLGRLEDDVQQRLSLVLRSGHRLRRLVEQLLDIARLEARALPVSRETHDLVAWLRRTGEAFSSMAERERIEYHVSTTIEPVYVSFDPDHMEKILVNLLGNAMKFTPEDGRVELRIITARAGSEVQAIIEIEDTGPGIPADRIDHVFDRFYQVDGSSRRKHEGAGIGLALAKELVTLHDGTLSVESTEGVGTTFRVTLPTVAAPTEPEVERAVKADLLDAPEDADPESAASVVAVADDDVTTVLVVEDNAELRQFLADRLRDEYRVLEAGDGAEGLAVARAAVPDLVVSDVMMPEMDGNQLCRAIKDDPEIDFIPVILLTAKASLEDRLDGLEGGADDYLAKPVDLRELMVRAANLLTSRRRLRERFRAENRQLPTLELPVPSGALESEAQRILDKLRETLAAHVGDEGFEIDAFARAMAMSRSTLYRRLNALLGQSPMDVLLNYRLDQSAQWLRETDANVSEIAYGVGFKSVPHFCAKFRERFGATPSSYRSGEVSRA